MKIYKREDKEMTEVSKCVFCGFTGEFIVKSDYDFEGKKVFLDECPRCNSAWEKKVN
jgi:hypothetical protein